MSTTTSPIPDNPFPSSSSNYLSSLPDSLRSTQSTEPANKAMTLSSTAVADPKSTIPPRSSTPSSVWGKPLDSDTPERNRQLIHAVKSFLFDVIYSGPGLERHYARFYALETIARIPYFAYLSVLHLMETLGRWRQAETLQVHFAESWNELHHLMTLEELGGNDRFFDRFIAQHVAWFYYWMVAGLYLFHPTLAYNLNQAVEEEAYETYDKFCKSYRDELERLPAPQVARKYYTGSDLYMFDAMHTPLANDKSTATEMDVTAAQQSEPAAMQERRRPKCDTLYDTFMNIRDDEMEHVKTMAYMQQIVEKE
jgi:Alternative oxidase